jgi:hypothetical protein
VGSITTLLNDLRLFFSTQSTMLAVCFFRMSLDVFIASNFMTRLGWEWSCRVLWSTSKANQQWLPPSLSATSGDRVHFLADLIFRYWQPRERPLTWLTPFLTAFLTRQWSGYGLPRMDHGYGYQVCVSTGTGPCTGHNFSHKSVTHDGPQDGYVPASKN